MDPAQFYVHKVLNFGPERPWLDGFVHFGFHDRKGNQYILDWDRHYVGLLGEGDRLLWTAGPVSPGLSSRHFEVGLGKPTYVTDLPDGRLAIASHGTTQLFALDPDEGQAEVLVDGARLGMKDLGNCVADRAGTLWVNEIEGCRVWRFDASGRPLAVIGDGVPGFQSYETPWVDTRFNWIYDIRLGPNGNLYVLDSKNYALRMVDLNREVVVPIAGTGQGGYSGDGGPASSATLGTNPTAYFDGPYSLSLDEEGNIFIGDTQNHVVRMIEADTGIIRTIAGNGQAVPGLRNRTSESDPLRLHLPLICSMDYHRGFLLVPDASGDLAVLTRLATD